MYEEYRSCSWDWGVVRWTERGVATNSNTYGRSEIEMMKVDVCERVQIVSSVGRTLSRCRSSQIHIANRMSIRNECEVKSSVQITLVVGKHCG